MPRHGGGPLQTSNEGPVKGQPGTVRPAKTFRSVSGRPVAAGVWVCAALSLAWLLVTGDPSGAVRAAPWLVLLSWFVYVSQWRPCLRIDGSGFDVINGLRDHKIPFGAVKDIEVRYTTAIWTAGKKYVSWGAPTPPSALGPGFQNEVNLKSRHFTVLPGNERFSQPDTTRTGRDAIVAAWQEARTAGLTPTNEGVVSTWSVPVVVVGLLAILSVIASALG